MIWFLLFLYEVKCLSLEKTEPKPEPVLGPIPIDVGFKSLETLSGQEQLGSETCVLCKMAIAKIDEFIANPENDVSTSEIMSQNFEKKLSREKLWMLLKKLVIISQAIMLIDAKVGYCKLARFA